jgi:hypothetical protein
MESPRIKRMEHLKFYDNILLKNAIEGKKKTTQNSPKNRKTPMKERMPNSSKV